ncbi:MAG: hypothetical protein FWF86_09495 [Clostridia bacterium]|nr:hypothetical protein [Clostridia bacterium]
MRKFLFCTCTTLLALTLALLAPQPAPAQAETLLFDGLHAALELPEDYIVLIPNNLDHLETWLSKKELSVQMVTDDFAKRGVLLQCWTQEGDACLEITAVQTDQTLMIFDVNLQDTSTRARYRLSHYPENLYTDTGYNFSSADWKNTSEGRFLILRYLMRDGGEIAHRGLMRRTIRNGHEITFDWKVFGRSLTNKDTAALNGIWGSFHFSEVLPLPPKASANLSIIKPPPAETNKAEFTIDGTAARDVKLTAVVMGLSAPEPTLVELEVGASGKFRIPIRLPKEGAFMITFTAEYQGEEIVELAYPVTYQHTLLAVNLTTPVPEVITTPSLVLMGTSEPGASIQVLLNEEQYTHKKVTAAGKFKIELNTAKEGPYEVVLVFTKGSLADRRLVYQFTRKWTEADMLKELRNQAIKPAYNALKNKIASYEGRIMGYRCYMLNVAQSGDEWIAQMALAKSGKEYHNMILVTCSEEPTVPLGERVMMYGTCVGMSLPSEEDETQASFPCFELLLFVSLE